MQLKSYLTMKIISFLTQTGISKGAQMKQIMIYDLLPLLRKGWVACNCNGSWRWYKYKPQCRQRFGLWNTEYERNESCFASLTAFNIAPFDGSWKDSLIKVEHNEEE